MSLKMSLKKPCFLKRWLGDLEGHLAAKISIKSEAYQRHNERFRTTPSATRQGETEPSRRLADRGGDEPPRSLVACWSRLSVRRAGRLSAKLVARRGHWPIGRFDGLLPL